ncbi:MAG: hypothetical protein KA059_02130 [Elusimicrobiales bacterium]|nr:hypothetical protein [Elusimicrobiales bacterium]
MKKVIFCLISIFLYSCATTSNYEKILSSWVGGDINDLIMSWGVPSYEYKMPSENKMYIWLWMGKTLVSPKSYEATIKKLAAEGGDMGVKWCKTSFSADKNNRILHFRFEGSYCKAHKP